MDKLFLLLFSLFSLGTIVNAQVEKPLNLARPDTIKPKVQDTIIKVKMDTARFWRDSMERRRYLRDGEFEKDRAARLRTKRRKFKYRYSDRIQYAGYITWPYTTSAGIPTSLLLHKAAVNLQDELVPASWWTDSTNRQLRKSIPNRLLRMLLLDLTVESVFTSFQQDIAGQLLRAQEQDVPFSVYGFRPPIPFWLPPGKLDLSDPNLLQKYSRQQLAQISSAGIEASQMAMDQLSYRWILRGAVEYREALLYLRHQTANFSGLMLSANKGPGVNPFDNYLYYINREYGHIDSYKYDASDMKRDYMISVFTNPFLYNSIINVFHNYLRFGEDSVKLKAIPLGYAKNVMPWVQLNLTPFGTEWKPQLSVNFHRQAAIAYARIGSKAFANSYGGGLKLFNIVRNTKASLNLEAAFWNQKYFYRSWSGQTTEPIGWGGLLAANCYFKLGNNPNPISLAINAGMKTKGYVEGEPWKAGPIIRVGLSFTLDGDYEEDDSVPEYEFVTSRKSKKGGIRKDRRIRRDIPASIKSGN